MWAHVGCSKNFRGRFSSGVAREKKGGGFEGTRGGKGPSNRDTLFTVTANGWGEEKKKRGRALPEKHNGIQGGKRGTSFWGISLKNGSFPKTWGVAPWRLRAKKGEGDKQSEKVCAPETHGRCGGGFTVTKLKVVGEFAKKGGPGECKTKPVGG